jgi:DNA-binding CsgD family transcriptional regulator
MRAARSKSSSSSQNRGSGQRGPAVSFATPPAKHPEAVRGSPSCDGQAARAREVNETVERSAPESVAVFLLNSSGEVIAANEHTSGIAACPVPPKLLRSIKDVCAATIRRFVACNQSSAGCAWSTEFSLGDLMYRGRAFPLPPDLFPAHTVFLLERVPTRREVLSRLCAEFRLTRRELETVELLARGLTNKEIAVTMGLSCNTVKTFLRSVMLKLRISTRAGVIGALVAHMG